VCAPIAPFVFGGDRGFFFEFIDRGGTPPELSMGQQRILGIVMLVVGIALLVVGLNSSHSVADQVSNTFTGRFTQATTWYIIGGIGVGVLGLVMLISGTRGKSA
jgi:hypothetical protein